MAIPPVRQIRKIEVEPLFDGFVRSYGGRVLKEHISNVNPPSNADYYFDSPAIVAELKCINRDAFTQEDHEKLQALFSSGQERRLIIVYGTRKVSLRQLPEICQKEWLALLTASRKRRIAKADEQIKKTKSFLNTPTAKGVLFLVNDASTFLPPVDEMNLVAQILKSKKPDNTNVFSHLHWIVYFSVNPKTVTPQGMGLNFWLPCHRELNDMVTAEFLEKLRVAWIRYHSEQIGVPTFEAPVSPNEAKSFLK